MEEPRKPDWWAAGCFAVGLAVMSAVIPDIISDAARWVALAFALGLMALSAIIYFRPYWIFHKRPRLEVVFDTKNPQRKFWSIEAAPAPEGKAPTHTYWEYRALIQNCSSKTVRNVTVTVEAIGPMPTRPEPSYFDLNKKQSIDLHPGGETLAVIRRWFNPPIVVGMVLGGAYGPIKMKVSADDEEPVIKLFRFNPELTPMISELPESPDLRL